MKQFRTFITTETKENVFNYSIQKRNLADLPKSDLLIKVQYSSLNYKDALSATGNKGVTKKYPHTPGIDAVGIVEESKNKNFPINSSVIVSGYDLPPIETFIDNSLIIIYLVMLCIYQFLLPFH